MFLSQVKTLWIVEIQKLVELRNETPCEIQKTLSKKEELNRLCFFVNNYIKKCKKGYIRRLN